MDPGGVEAQPDHSAEQEENRDASDPDARGSCDDGKANQPQSKRTPIQGVAIADGHDQDRSHVIEDRQGQEKQAESRRDAGAEECEASYDERRIGGHHGAPAMHPRLAGHERKIEGRGHEHAAERTGERQRRHAQVPQLTQDEFTLELKGDHKEEERHQGIVDPMPQ
jgi:hypothetical protein